MSSLSRRITLHGHSIAYRTAGEGPLLVLVHGMVGSSATWERVIAALTKKHTVIAPDLLGHGDSAKPLGDYSLGGYASGIRDLMVALGHERATLCGQSFGGGVAMQFAYQFPERCSGLILVGSGGLGREVNPLLRALTLPGAEWVLPLTCTPLFKRLGGAAVRRLRRAGRELGPTFEELARSYSALTRSEDRRAFVHTLRSVIDLGGQRVSAHDLLYLSADVPTMIVWGDADRVIPIDHAYAAHSAIRGSRLEVFPGVGHYPHCEAPERFVEVVQDFLRHVPPRTMTEQRLRELLLSASAPA
jgi:pimeloyl-ACP methyl ester carboxylesterase